MEPKIEQISLENKKIPLHKKGFKFLKESASNFKYHLFHYSWMTAIVYYHNELINFIHNIL